jgi:hypothetical protein
MEVAQLLLWTFTVILTGAYVYLSKQLLDESRVQRRPSICAYVSIDEKNFGLLDLIIENTGKGPALELKFEIAVDTPSALSVVISKVGAVQHGIKYLAPGQRYRTHIASSFEGGPELWKSRFEIRASYRDRHGKGLEDVCPIDTQMFEGVTKIGRDDLQRIADSMEKIQGKLRSRSYPTNGGGH